MKIKNKEKKYKKDLLTSRFQKLRSNKISLKEYQLFKKQCIGIIKKLCIRYSLKNIVSKPIDIEDLVGEVYIISLTKAIKNFDSSKTHFSTYFYYKALSALRVELGKYKRRYNVLNTLPLISEIYSEENIDRI